MPNDERQEVAAVQTWYDQTADAFSLRYTGVSGKFWEQFEERVAMDLLPPAVHRVLDLGCGPGRLAASLSRRATHVLGVDLSPAMIVLARAQAHPGNVHYCVMDATRTALESERFDAVISLGMFEYLSDPAPFLREMLRILKPGGVTVFTCYSQPPRALGAPRAAARWLKSLVWRRPQTANHGRAYDRVRHEPARMVERLRSAGFVGVDFRGFHFLTTARLFRMTADLRSRRLAELGTGAAVWLDQTLGRLQATKAVAPLAMYRAAKP